MASKRASTRKEPVSHRANGRSTVPGRDARVQPEKCWPEKDVALVEQLHHGWLSGSHSAVQAVARLKKEMSADPDQAWNLWFDMCEDWFQFEHTKATICPDGMVRESRKLYY